MTLAHPPRHPLVAIVGPTASGKSALAIALAEQFGGEVVVCDSTQVYRHFDIGTGKPTRAEQRGVPHHLMDRLEPHEFCTAGTYRSWAIELLEELRVRERLPIFTVGTGLYLRALLEGLAAVPTRSVELRARLSDRARRRGPAYLHRILRRLDPAAAARIAPRDTPKLVRAIEVCLLAGRPLSELHRAGRQRLESFAAIKIGLMPPRKLLYQRIERRVQAMLARGWLGEVKELLARGVPPTVKPFDSIGYRELRAHLRGELSLAEAVEAIQLATRRYAKRQITWFRREPQVRWLEGFGDDPRIAREVLPHLQVQLAECGLARTRTSSGVS